ncbi:META domain-containing protein [Rhodoferax sp.]|uniref:META domain-containing protein n=1 Tax=Rhodoferax sp. TaxID=50421 RepID=UPI002ACE61B4|nr:META domain-containing protein [Rhodoferax sp.]MDZ7921044.1 META domain-containing protein [Rhodoferax sp.]
MALLTFCRWSGFAWLAVVLSACAVPTPSFRAAPASGAALVGNEWVASQIDGVTALVEPLPRLRWLSAEQIAGTGGCNGFAGRAVVNQGALQVGRLAATGRLCMALPQGGQEDRFFKVLESARMVRLIDGELVLQDVSGQQLARFSKKSP